ncbi:MAG: DNA alkylation repair protein [Clostridia bacterium]|nr:DNA alkylation repair protein [Clostridia bacterium]
MSDSKLKSELLSLAEAKYRDFMMPLLPTVSPERMLGVRMPILRKKADEMIRSGEYEKFLSSLPHRFYEEDAVHAYVLSKLSGDELISGLREFLPLIDNWGICDSLRPKAFLKNKRENLSFIYECLSSDHIYTARFASQMLMLHYLGDDFSHDMPMRVGALCCGEYYLDMMVAWYFATALSVRYDDIIPYLEERKLSVWVHNKTISKAIDSLRISLDKKEYLKTLRIKSK